MNIQMLEVAAVQPPSPPPKTDVGKTGDNGQSFQQSLESRVQDEQPRTPASKNETDQGNAGAQISPKDAANSKAEQSGSKPQEALDAAAQAAQQAAAAAMVAALMQTQVHKENGIKKQEQTENRSGDANSAKKVNPQAKNPQSLQAHAELTLEKKDAKAVKTGDEKKFEALQSSSQAKIEDKKDQATLQPVKGKQILDDKNAILEVKAEQKSETILSVKEGVVVDAKGQVQPFSEVISVASQKKTEALSTVVLPQVDQGIRDMLDAGKGTLKLQIYPESLGKVEIKLTSGNDGMQVVLSVDKASTGKLLEDNLSQLQHSLMEAGVTIGSMTVNQQASQNDQQNWKKTQQHNIQSTYGNVESVEEEVGPLLRNLDTLSSMSYRV